MREPNPKPAMGGLVSELQSILEDIRLTADGARTRLAQDAAMRRATIFFAGMLAVILIGMFGSFADMARIWRTTDAYSYGFFIAPISIWLIWRKRSNIAAVSASQSAVGAVLLVGGAGAWFLARLAGVSVIEQLAAASLIPAAVLAAYGWRMALTLWFPLGFLIFMAPFGQSLIPPLQDFTAEFVVAGLRGIGIPVLMDGIFIHIPTGSFKVAEACAGLNFLLVCIVVGALFAYLTFRNWIVASAFILISIIVPIVANGFRALGIVLIAYMSNHQLAVGVDHLVYGFVFLSIVMAMIFLIGVFLWRFDKAPPEKPVAAPSPIPARSLASRSAVAVGLLALLGAIAAERVITAPPAPRDIALVAPEIEGWELRAPLDDAYQPEFPGADAQGYWTYASSATGQTVSLYVAWYLYERDGAEAVNSQNIPYDRGENPLWDRAGGGVARFEAEGVGLTLPKLDLVKLGAARRSAWQAYWTGGVATGSRTRAKLNSLRGLLTGRRNAAAISVSAPYAARIEEADAAIASFLSASGGVERLLENIDAP